MRHFRVLALLHVALSISVAAPAWCQEMASAADSPAGEHVRHLRSRKVAKPLLTTDEDKPEPGEAAEPAPTASKAPKPASVETTEAPAPRQKKIAAKPAKPAPAKPKAVARKETSRSAPLGEAPASRGLLEDLFGDN